MRSLPKYIESRIRQDPPVSAPIVPGSTPVIAFGDSLKATVATLSWNPSKLEFCDRHGNELTGAERRLETLASLDAKNLSSAADAVYEIFQGCNAYFQRRPYRKWFDVLEKVLLSLGASYYAGTACHLDLVQWATDPTWADLRAEHKKSLIDADLPFLHQQLSQGNIRLLPLNGSGIAKAVRKTLDCELVEKVVPGKGPPDAFRRPCRATRTSDRMEQESSVVVTACQMNT